jgi:hypothetical protein
MHILVSLFSAFLNFVRHFYIVNPNPKKIVRTMRISIAKPPILGQKKCMSDISGFITMKLFKVKSKAHFRWCPRSKFLGTNLDSFEAN